MVDLALPPRWYPLRYHPEHARRRRSRARFKVTAAGRRSGKTELEKREGVEEDIADARFADGWGVYAAPTHDQAVRIWWNDLKSLVPDALVDNVKESSPPTIRLVTGYEMTVMGLEKPERIEGRSLDRIRIDEVDNLKGPHVIWDHVLPALGTTGRQGAGSFFGVPEGRTILYALKRHALRPENRREWDYFHWKSSEVLLPHEDAFFRRNMDPLAYDREFNASFLDFEGRAYYPFRLEVHAVERLHYDPTLPLCFCFDFNVEPGVAVILQEQPYRGRRPEIAPIVTAVLGEVWIPRDSNTERVCRKLIEDWGGHRGPVRCYGDATGGARGSAKVRGSDWDLIGGREGLLRQAFGERLELRVPRENGPVKARVNAVNRRLLTADGIVRMLVDPARAPHVCEDLDGVTLVKGGAFEIDKRKGEAVGLTHLSDALGYYVVREHPLAAGPGLSVLTA